MHHPFDNEGIVRSMANGILPLGRYLRCHQFVLRHFWHWRRATLEQDQSCSAIGTKKKRIDFLDVNEL